ncbi:hypothetical protein [Arcticibacter sp. MXS-1]|uniref:hypothetical protein n=1 Tax=Arcticibacter sp. MXS-1 TaxID=3341726 RepID=UPI0035A8910F
MEQIIIGSLLLSALHAVIPSHWLPIIAIGRKENWSIGDISEVTFYSGLAHVVSTVLLGTVFAALGLQLSVHMDSFSHIFAPVILIILGLIFIYRNHRHKHFHLHQPNKKSKREIVIALVVSMFLSPCLEIEAYFLMAGSKGWSIVALLSILYSAITIIGMVIWVRFTYRGFLKLNWHAYEHNAGIITGLTLIITGIVTFFIH